MADPNNSNQSASDSQKMNSAGQDANSKSDQDKTGGEQSCHAAATDWIEILLVGEDGVGIRYEKCTVTDPDGKVHQGRTDANGLLRVAQISTGECEVCFIDLDSEAWEEAK